MLTGLLRRVLRKCALEHNRLVGLYRRVCRPNNFEWAEYLRRHGGLHAMGEHCAVVPNVVITDPPHVSIGSNVSLSGCTLFGHGGGIPMLKRAYGVPLDKVGKIVIHDNVFIGHQAIVADDGQPGCYKSGNDDNGRASHQQPRPAFLIPGVAISTTQCH